MAQNHEYAANFLLGKHYRKQTTVLIMNQIAEQTTIQAHIV